MSFSNTVVALTPFRLRTRAAANPAAPTPITATFKRGFGGWLLPGAAAAATAAPTAPVNEDDDAWAATDWFIVMGVGLFNTGEGWWDEKDVTWKGAGGRQ